MNFNKNIVEFAFKLYEFFEKKNIRESDFEKIVESRESDHLIQVISQTFGNQRVINSVERNIKGKYSNSDKIINAWNNIVKTDLKAHVFRQLKINIEDTHYDIKIDEIIVPNNSDNTRFTVNIVYNSVPNYNENLLIDHKLLKDYFPILSTKNINNPSVNSNIEQNCVRLECLGYGDCETIEQLVNSELHPWQIYLYLYEERFGLLVDQLKTLKFIEENKGKIEKERHELEELKILKQKDDEAFRIKMNEIINNIQEKDNVISDLRSQVTTAKNENSDLRNKLEKLQNEYNKVLNDRNDFESRWKLITNTVKSTESPIVVENKNNTN